MSRSCRRGRGGRRRAASAGLACVLAAALTSACDSASPTPRLSAAPASAAPSGAPASGPPVTDGDWPTYHKDNARTGVAEGMPPVGTLSIAWKARLDGAVYGQPLVVGGVVFAGTENDSVYALDAASGEVRWSAHLGTPVRRAQLPCGDIDPLGITSTMVYGPATRLVFALAETAGAHHELVGLDAATGAVRVRRAVEPPRGDRTAHQQRSALTLLDGRVYIAYGGLFGDCGDYIGSVVAVPTSGDGPLLSYAVPTSREAGIWAPGGAAVHDGRLLYAVGNGESTSGYDGSDSVIVLSPDLRLLDRFSPSVWPEDNARDLDLGSMSPAVVGDHVLIVGKRGVGYTLPVDHLRGVGPDSVGGELAQAKVCRAFGGPAVDGDTVYVPCADGLRAVRVDAAGRLSTLWHAPVGANGSPVAGGGAVWVVDYDDGVLYALDPASGAVRARIDVGRAPHFASPSLAAGRAYIGTMDGVTAVGGV